MDTNELYPLRKLYPLRNFAKLFRTSAGQVLAQSSENEDGFPALTVGATLSNGVHVQIEIGGWEDNEEGWAKADAALDGFDDTSAEKFATEMLPGIIPDGLIK